MRVVCALACRAVSSRLYGKPLQLISIEENLSILEFILNQLQAQPLINETILAISEGDANKPFIEVARRRGLQYVIGDEQDVLGRLILAGKKGQADIVFRITSECPFIYWEGLQDALQKHVNNNASLTLIEGLPEGAYFELINLKDLELEHRDGEQRHRSELCTLYISEHPELFKIQALPVDDTALKRPDIRLTVDYPEDLIVARKLYKGLNKPGENINVRQCIEYLDNHPELNKLNSAIETGAGRIWN